MGSSFWTNCSIVVPRLTATVTLELLSSFQFLNLPSLVLSASGTKALRPHGMVKPTALARATDIEVPVTTMSYWLASRPLISVGQVVGTNSTLTPMSLASPFAQSI